MMKTDESPDEKENRDDAIYNVVVMDLKLREIRGLWIALDCS